MNPKVDFFFEKDVQWQEAYQLLRTIINDCQLEETLKWGCPCYQHNEHNIVLIHGFKDYCALLFMKGVLMGDENGILIQQTKNVQSARQIRFKQIEEIAPLASVIKKYVFEAIEIEKAGLKVAPKKSTVLEYPSELRQELEDNPTLKTAFEALTPGRQKGYCLFFSAPKQVKTRASRIEKYKEKIMQGKGLNDR
ncbi:hypothetical protein DNU06_01555 [Putridiphycobacter roseus]|uniref:YdhG-like domain-containing protein n=1 Tax=Putridiphycobacter roseus TaxID=2219161 RepID=A0A2W1NGC3_9FLAO|nr:DUF1801 domain-containing protein [Putridiphycobacter roseus]PZE18545.1 hypothetical protein DNU06_01555 [Putridiphycobacter roseus]